MQNVLNTGQAVLQAETILSLTSRALKNIYSRFSEQQLTFALQALPEEAFEQLLAVLADSRPGVGVNQECVGNFDF